MADNIVIDCADCVVRADGVCDDCVVTFIVDREPSDAVVIELSESRAMRRLASAGLIPELKHVSGTAARDGGGR